MYAANWLLNIATFGYCWVLHLNPVTDLNVTAHVFVIIIEL